MGHVCYSGLLKIAHNRLADYFDYVDFESNIETTNKIVENFTHDALLEAGSSISIRWLSEEEQKARLEGIETMMFDNIMEDKDLITFYRDMIEVNTVLKGNRLIFKSNFVHHKHVNTII